MPSFRLSSGSARLLRDTVLFVLGLTAFHFGVQFAHKYAAFDAPRWWPLSIFNPRTPTPVNILLAVGVALGFVAALWRLERTQYRRFAEVAVLGLLLILGANAVQGPDHGFVRPTAGGTIQYYHDALQHSEPSVVFLNEFNRIQPTLGDHARTHPPGAVLLFRALILLTGDSPARISVLIAVSGSLLSAYFFRLLLSAAIPNASANAAVFLLLLLPALQIYYCASLDAVIASLLLGTIGLFCLPSTRLRIVGSTVCLVTASFLTFGFVWVLPLLLIVEVNRWEGRRSLLRLAGLSAGLLTFYLALYVCCGFSYVAALRTATHLENPQGFRLLAEPLSYFFTRLEDIAEIALFTGPVLLSTLFQNLRRFQREHLLGGRLFLTALATLGALFLTGAYRTGETARACLFTFPYLLLPVLANPVFEGHKRKWLMAAVFGQALLMQLLGRYFW
jgi:hypothetical protein